MPEITMADEPEVATFIAATFGIEPGMAKDYARLAVFLSVEQQWQPAMAELSSMLQEQYWYRMYKGYANRLSGAIAEVGSFLGFSNYSNGLVLAGYTDPKVFASYVKSGAFWKDAVSSNHGEYSHSFQWLAIGLAARKKMLNLKSHPTTLFKESVGKLSTQSFYHPGRRAQANVYLWDFLVDCFDFGKEDPDYKANLTTDTPRSPTRLNTWLRSSDTWLGAHLSGRYQQRKWDADASIKEYATARSRERKYAQVAQNAGENYVFQRNTSTERSAKAKSGLRLSGLRGTFRLSSVAPWAPPGSSTPKSATVTWKTSAGTVVNLMTAAVSDRQPATDYPVRFDLLSDPAGKISVDNIAFSS